MKEHSLCIIVPVFNMVKYVGNCIDSPSSSNIPKPSYCSCK